MFDKSKRASKKVNGVVYLRCGKYGVSIKRAQQIFHRIYPEYIQNFRNENEVIEGFQRFCEDMGENVEPLYKYITFLLIRHHFPLGRLRNYAKGRHTKEEWEELKAEYGYKCAYCGQPTKLTKDHIIPLSSGGTDYISNIVPSCWPCNYKKRAMSLEQFKGAS